MAEIIVNENNFEEVVLKNEGPVLVDFWAAWCGPCRMLGPIVEELAGEMAGVRFAKVNVDEEPVLANAFRVNAIPTLVFMKDGKAVGQTVGLQGKEELRALIEKVQRS